LRPTKIVVIGAGSAIFGENTLQALMRSQKLAGSTLALVDQDARSLAIVAGLATRLNRELKAGFTISAHAHHKEALEGAHFVVSAIEVGPREGLWRTDYEIPLKYGVRQPYAENGGPGGFAHAMRNIGPVMEIVHAMEALCPNAWFINFTNPMVRICDAVNRYSTIKVVGLCHQVLIGYAMVGMALREELDIEVPQGITGMHADIQTRSMRRYVARQAVERIHIQAAGLNHFTWAVSMHDRQDGRDLYPLFRRRWSEMDASLEPLSRQIFDIFGLFPIPGDTHLCEYLPWMSDPNTRPWEQYDIKLYDWEAWSALRDEQLEHLQRLASGQSPLEQQGNFDSEGALEMIENIAGAGRHYHLAANLPNEGQIASLPLGAIVETPVLVDGAGVHPVYIGPLPEAISELCRRELAVVKMCVDAAIHGDRQTALHCLLLDPVIRDIDQARKILDDYLGTYREHLPQFWQ
jgi:alpha-galactosidase